MNFLIQTDRIEMDDVDFTVYYSPQTNTYVALETFYVENIRGDQEPIELYGNTYYFQEDFE